MKSIFVRLSALAGLMLLLTACPYQSRVPISQPTENVNKKIMDTWATTSEIEYDNPTYIEITKAGKSKVQYHVIEYTYSSSDSAYNSATHTMHTSTVGEYTFLNLQENSEGDYYIYRLDYNEDLDPDAFILYEVTDNVDETFNSSADLKSFVEKNMNTSFFYNKDEKKYVKYKAPKK